jgi:hypothetical protein
LQCVKELGKIPEEAANKDNLGTLYKLYKNALQKWIFVKHMFRTTKKGFGGYLYQTCSIN